MELTLAQKEMVSNNINLVYKMAAKLNLSNNQDAIQEGIMGLCVASTRYKDDKFKFSTYASNYIKYYMLNYINLKKLIKPKRKNNQFENAEIVELNEEIVGNKDERLEKFMYKDILSNAMSTFDDTTKMLIRMYSEGMTQAQIGKRLGMGQPVVCRKLKDALSILRERIL